MTDEILNEELIKINSNDKIDEFSEFQDSEFHSAVATDLRIEETVYRSWSGVRSCGDANRVSNEVRAAYEGWVAEKLFQYRHLRYKTYGHGEGSVRTRNSGGGLGSPRRCNGSLILPCYIVFQRK
ncbi:hypothetical protein [Cognataquiflexum aquatile]|uniref:hypothetical protein n=1 Tax=Cognataquiflexum aquatile TaxID=2249427 RepID=UPI0013008B86|nr:hypothetical protein [Cognataquiflexum aquatile]